MFCLSPSDLPTVQTASLLSGEFFGVNFAAFSIDSTGRALVLLGLHNNEIVKKKKKKAGRRKVH